ncbi:MAG TPA: methyltransferase domain-containing protein [Bacteroidales bacterium]|nr:methyltransferase domain-containing protein [Bacteroidales bacterium]
MNNYLRTHYDLSNPDLVSVIDELPLWSAPFGLKILETMQYRKNMKVLDIGFGLGFPLTEIAMRLGNSSQVYGVDPWEAAMERTQLKLKMYNIQNVNMVKGEAEHLPFEDGCFQLIVSNNGLNNVNDLPQCFRECQRVAAKRAQLIFTFNTAETFDGFYDILKSVLNGRGLNEQVYAVNDHIALKRPSLEHFKALAEENGFAVVSAEKSRFDYFFADAQATLNHFLINMAFLPSWRAMLDKSYEESVFEEIEQRIEKVIEQEGKFTMQVPFYTVNCRKG